MVARQRREPRRGIEPRVVERERRPEREFFGDHAVRVGERRLPLHAEDCEHTEHMLARDERHQQHRAHPEGPHTEQFVGIGGVRLEPLVIHLGNEVRPPATQHVDHTRGGVEIDRVRRHRSERVIEPSLPGHRRHAPQLLGAGQDVQQHSVPQPRQRQLRDRAFGHIHLQRLTECRDGGRQPTLAVVESPALGDVAKQHGVDACPTGRGQLGDRRLGRELRPVAAPPEDLAPRSHLARRFRRPAELPHMRSVRLLEPRGQQSRERLTE